MIIIIFLTSILSGLFFVRITRIAEKKYCKKEEELKTKGKKKNWKRKEKKWRKKASKKSQKTNDNKERDEEEEETEI